VKFSADTRDVSILAALADPIRLEIVKRLSKITGVELARRLGISRALLCHHAGILVGSGVATRRKAGKTGYLRLNATRLQRCIEKLGMRAPSRKSKRVVRALRTGARSIKPLVFDRRLG
jgi:ArsR family transcriptional regulator, arsenate/arsenite/antimonite-responsive transcriptional repressor